MSSLKRFFARRRDDERLDDRMNEEIAGQIV